MRLNLVLMSVLSVKKGKYKRTAVRVFRIIWLPIKVGLYDVMDNPVGVAYYFSCAASVFVKRTTKGGVDA